MLTSRTAIIHSWVLVIQRAIQLGDADAAYRLTVALVRRCDELGLPRRRP